MTQTFVSLEKVIRRAPLGVRFVDLVRNTPVEDGLDVRVWPLGHPGSALIAERSPVSGIYGVRSLPGLRDYETGTAAASAWCTGTDEASEANFVLHVEDRLGRFLTQARLVCLPKESLLQVELVSSPARPGVVGFVQAVGEVWDQTANQAAAWALVSTADEAYVTIADHRGMFALYLPFPAPPPGANGSTSLGDLTWDFSFRVRYQPTHQTTITGAKPPDTVSITEQSFATLYDTYVAGDAGATVTGPTITRQFSLGSSLVLKTQGDDIARLLITT